MNITITSNAVTHIRKIIEAEPGAVFFRLGLKRSGCSGYRYDPVVVSAPESDDVEQAVEGFGSIYIAANSEVFYEGLTIDLKEQFLGHQLVFINPNAENECGCGESFSLKDSGSEVESEND